MTTKDLARRLPPVGAHTIVDNQFSPAFTPKKTPSPPSNPPGRKADQERGTINRRGVLMNMIATAFVPAAVAAAPLDHLARASSGDDPIFVLLAEHRDAWDRYDEADAVHSKLREEADEEGLYDLPKIHLYDFPEKKVETILYTDQEWHTRFTLTGKMIPVFASHPHDITKNAPRGLTKSKRAYWIRKKKRELQRAEDARMEFIRNSEYGRHYDAWNAADEVLREITTRLVQSRPTTAAGAAAALKHVAKFAIDHDDQFDSDDAVAQFMANIAAALDRIIERERGAA